jgi:signal transduction histidine kinase
MAAPRLGRQVRSLLFDLLVSLLVVALTLISYPRQNHLLPLRLIGLGMAVALLGRRRYPLVVTAVVSALALQQVLWYPPDNDPLPYDVAVLIAMYSTVKYSPRLWQALAAAVPVAIGIGIELARHGARNTVFVAAFYLALCGGTWLGGYTVRTRRLYVAGLEERAATAERERDHLARIAVVEERATIARELHDVVAHSLAVMIVQADGATYALDGEPEQARVAIKQVAATGRDALEDMRRLVSVLRSPDATPRQRLTLDELVARAGIPVDVRITGDRPELPAAVELTVFRIVQEALTNVLRHAGSGASVRLSIGYRPGSVEVEMVDDGAGTVADERWLGAAPTSYAAAAVDRPDGHGLVGMRERVLVHEGTFEAGPVLGGGWRVRADIPFGTVA